MKKIFNFKKKKNSRIDLFIVYKVFSHKNIKIKNVIKLTVEN